MEKLQRIMLVAAMLSGFSYIAATGLSFATVYAGIALYVARVFLAISFISVFAGELWRVKKGEQKWRSLRVLLTGMMAAMNTSDIFFFSHFATVEKLMATHYIIGAFGLFLIFLETMERAEQKTEAKDHPSAS